MIAALRPLAFVVVVAGLSMTLGVAPQDAKSPTAAPAQTPAGSAGDVMSLVVDRGHSSNVFKVRHNGVASFYGRFNDMSGTVVWNPADPAASSINVEVKTESVDTNSEGRDKHLKSPDFFDAAAHPTFSFKSTSIKKTGDNTYDVTGDLNLHGMTKSITVKFDQAGPVEGRGGPVMGLETTFTIKRTDYGMTKYVDPKSLGDDVTMTVAMECVVPRKRGGE